VNETILDVGCGAYPKGDVNVDFSSIVENPRNFVLADAELNVIYASHLLEHVKRPFDVLLEFKRVSKSVVYLHVPSSACPNHCKHHIYRWDSNTFENLLTKIFSEVSIHSTERIFPEMGKLNVLRLILEKLYHNIFHRRQMTAICKVNGESD